MRYISAQSDGFGGTTMFKQTQKKHAKDGNWAWGTCNNIVMYRIYISDRDFELKVPVFNVLKHMRVSGSITTANKQPRW